MRSLAAPDTGTTAAGGPLGPLAARVQGLAGWRRRLTLAGLGLIATLALPPWHVLPALLVAFPLWVWLIEAAPDNRAAFGAGWWFGFGHFVLGFYWISEALLTDPARWGWMIPFAVGGLAGGMALFPALAAWAAWRSRLKGVGLVILLAAAWAVTEWLRSWVLTGFPWNLIAYVWTANLAVAQFAALAGSFGLGMVTVAIAAMPATLSRPGFKPRAAAGLAALALAVLWAWGSWRLAAHPTAYVPGVRLRLVQADIAETAKWDPKKAWAHFQRHLALSRGPGFDQVTDVIWPETAVPYLLANQPELLKMVATAAPPGGLVITGALRATPQGVHPFHIWNSLHAVDGAGRIVATYDKAHLVPFGEYVPLQGWLPLRKLTPGSVDFTPGPGPRTLDLPRLPPVGPLICYEAIFPGAVVQPGHRPDWLLNITNDGWFGLSSGPHQHFASAQFRAIEEGLPLIRDANTGISGAIDPLGRVLSRLGLGREGVLDTGLPRPLSATPYARFGNWTWFIMLAAGVILAYLATRRG